MAALVDIDQIAAALLTSDRRSFIILLETDRRSL